MMPNNTDELVEYLMETKPYLLQAMIKRNNPALSALLDRCSHVQYGKIELTVTLRAGEIEKMQFKEEHDWKRPLDPKSKG